MSSKDKTGDDDDATETGVADNTKNPNSDHPDSDTAEQAASPTTAAQDAENKEPSEIEDAVLLDEDTAGDSVSSNDAASSTFDRDADETADADPDSPGPKAYADAGSADDSDTGEDMTQTPENDTGGNRPEEPAAVAPPPPPPPPPPAPQKSGGGFFPAVLGGLVAAGLGFGAAQFLGVDMLGGGQDATQERAAQNARLSGLEEKLDAIAAALEPQGSSEAEAQLEALGENLTAQFSDVANGITSSLTELDTRLSTLGDRMRTLEMTPLVESSEASQQAFSSYEKDLENLRAELEAQIAANAEAEAEAEARVAEAQADIEAAAEKTARLQKQAEEQARVAQEQAEAKSRSAAIREAMTSLDSYLQTGAPFGYALDILGEGVEVPAPLKAAAENGVVTLPELRDSFPELARDALDASIRQVVDDDITERVIAFVKTQTGVRSLAPREGDDPDAILSRAEAALEVGELEETLTELGQLPPAGQQVMADWVERAQTRLSVLEAADTLANTLLAN